MPTPRQLMLYSRPSMFTEESTCFDIFPVSYMIPWSLTSSIQCSSACLTTSRSGFSTSWRHTKVSTSTMQSVYPCMLTTTSYQKIIHDAVSQWNGKEMKQLSQYMLGVATQSHWCRSPTQYPTFNCAIECIQALLEFYMYAQYISHNKATLSYMEDSFHRFHTFKDVSLLRRAGKMVKYKASALRTELVQKQKVDEETNADTWTSSKMWCWMNAWWDYISHEVDVSKE